MTGIPHDKHNKPVHVGDTVELVYGGDEHHTEVLEIERDEHGHAYVIAVVRCRIPVTAVSKRYDENSDTAPKEGTKPTHRTHKKESETNG